MKVGVLSDTHIPNRAKRLPDEVIQAFREVDHIIHAGDISCQEVLDLLAQMADVSAVGGNIDPIPLREALGTKKIITLSNFKIGITHGHGSTGKTLDRAIKTFESDAVDCIVFGHSHIPYCEYNNGILMFNPGSPTDKRRNAYFSFGILELNEDMKAKHIYFR